MCMYVLIVLERVSLKIILVWSIGDYKRVKIIIELEELVGEVYLRKTRKMSLFLVVLC